jgi:hypothetical protein
MVGEASPRIFRPSDKNINGFKGIETGFNILWYVRTEQWWRRQRSITIEEGTPDRDELWLQPNLSKPRTGRLCSFSQCPKGKPQCLVTGCGAIPFNKRVAEFMPHADLLAPARHAMLYERDVGRLRSALDLPAVEPDRAPSGSRE